MVLTPAPWKPPQIPTTSTVISEGYSESCTKVPLTAESSDAVARSDVYLRSRVVNPFSPTGRAPPRAWNSASSSKGKAARSALSSLYHKEATAGYLQRQLLTFGGLYLNAGLMLSASAKKLPIHKLSVEGLVVPQLQRPLTEHKWLRLGGVYLDLLQACKQV
ncbi:MAG: hypothetical protein FRX49_03065 [Trebouxia sp. A1-2]|nr:MAG: hypothetical protein FRX49_03065 [Trebouxia sp. A1-2]